MVMEVDEASAVLAEAVKDADMVLVGAGAEWKGAGADDYQALSGILSGKNYFLLTTLINAKEAAEGSELKHERIVAPSEGGFEPADWDRYTKWLAGTMNRKLVLLELGVLFDHAEIIRWPFERIAYLSNKAKLFRVNELFPQLSEELKERAISVKMDSREFVKEMNSRG